MTKKKFIGLFATVYTDDNGVMRIVLPTGEDFPHLTETIIKDAVNDEWAEITFKSFVNITQTREQALEKYNQLQQNHEKIIKNNGKR